MPSTLRIRFRRKLRSLPRINHDSHWLLAKKGMVQILTLRYLVKTYVALTMMASNRNRKPANIHWYGKMRLFDNNRRRWEMMALYWWLFDFRPHILGRVWRWLVRNFWRESLRISGTLEKFSARWIWHEFIIFSIRLKTNAQKIICVFMMDR